MRRILFILFITSAIHSISYAQSAKSIQFELGGPGLASLNFDTRFSNKENGIGGRIGIGGFSIDEVSAVFVPIGINYLIGKDTKNYFEIGGGITPVFLSGEDVADNEDDNFSTTFGHLLFGYRFQPLNDGFTFRVFVSPVFGKGYFMPYYGGVSFGYKFGGKK